MKPLKRHPALIELSRDHHRSLSLCVRLLRTPAESHRAQALRELLRKIESL